MITEKPLVSFREIVDKIPLEVVVNSNDLSNTFFSHVMASDLMSDVLMIGSDVDLLVTSLSTDQVIRTAQIMDMIGVVIVNGKEITDQMIELSKDFGITIFSSDMSKYDVCCALSDLQKGN